VLADAWREKQLSGLFELACGPYPAWHVEIRAEGTGLRCDDMTRCTECDFDYELTNALRAWRLRWSTPTSCCFGRTISRVYSSGLRRMCGRRWSMPATFVICCWCRANGCWPRVAEIGPLRSRWDLTRGLEHDGYNNQRPGDVARQLTDATLLLSNALARLSLADWERTVIYTYPERAERPLGWVAAHTLHELRHHLLDVRRQLDQTDAADSKPTTSRLTRRPAQP
jgi:hypothetical protein